MGRRGRPSKHTSRVGHRTPSQPSGSGSVGNGGDSDDVVSVLAKRLVRQNAQELVLEQFNPAATFTVPKSRVTRVHRILQQTELLFG